MNVQHWLHLVYKADAQLWQNLTIYGRRKSATTTATDGTKESKSTLAMIKQANSAACSLVMYAIRRAPRHVLFLSLLAWLRYSQDWPTHCETRARRGRSVGKIDKEVVPLYRPLSILFFRPVFAFFSFTRLQTCGVQTRETHERVKRQMLQLKMSDKRKKTPCDLIPFALVLNSVST